MTEKADPSKKATGRPPFEPTRAHRTTVEQMRYVGDAEETIARAIGISVETLKKYFGEELADGHAKRRKEVVGYIFKSAKGGNVSAQRRLEEMGRGVNLRDAPGRRAPEAEAGPEHLGKKAAAQADADAAVAEGGRFAPRNSPRLAVVGGQPVEAE